jgi:hypothetical protein
VPLQGIPSLFGGRRGSAAVVVTPNLLTGITNGTARNDFDTCAGVQWLTGAGGGQPTITHLSRWKIAGNSLTHTIYLCIAAPFSIVTSVSVNMSTGSAGSYVSTALGSPYTVIASTLYAIMSTETNGGDQWYNSDTTVGGIYSGFSISGAVYDPNNPPITTNLFASGSFTFVPVNAVLTP